MREQSRKRKRTIKTVKRDYDFPGIRGCGGITYNNE
jgi:hypothetical protein